MKIKSTKNIIKEIKGTNTFEVLTFGKRQELDELRSKLIMHGFNFGEDGEPENACLRREKLVDFANGFKGEEKTRMQSEVEVILDDLQKYIKLYLEYIDKDYVFKYILDMNDIEIEINEDINGKRNAKVSIKIKDNEKDNLIEIAES